MDGLGRGAAPSEGAMARDQDGATALHHAAYDGDLDRIRHLLAAGAETDPPSLRAGLFALRAAGEAPKARQIALQTLLATPGG